MNARIILAGTLSGTLLVLGLLITDPTHAAEGRQSLQEVASQPGDLNGDGVVDQTDLDILLAAKNTPATGPGDPRDLNGDGKIDALDARKLVTLCTRPGCTTK